MRRIAVLDAPSNLGLRPPTATSVPGCAKAPGALRDHGLLRRLNARDAGCLTPPRYDPGDWRPGDGVCHAPEISAYSRKLADRIGAILDQGEFPVILGGDCSIVLGSALAMHRLGEAVGGRIGLVFVDGHSDFRHPGNASYVGAAAGEDLALVTGRGQTDLAAMEGRRPYYRDIDVVVMGIRAQDEYRLDLQAAGIVTRPVPALRVEGAARSAQWARDQLVDCAGYWVHIDVDVLDPAVMPAVDAPEPGGIAFPELEILLAGLVESPHCLGVEITVFDPDYDPDGKYAEEITSAIVAGLKPAQLVDARPDLVAARRDLAGPGRLGSLRRGAAEADPIQARRAAAAGDDVRQAAAAVSGSAEEPAAPATTLLGVETVGVPGATSAPTSASASASASASDQAEFEALSRGGGSPFNDDEYLEPEASESPDHAVPGNPKAVESFADPDDSFQPSGATGLTDDEPLDRDPTEPVAGGYLASGGGLASGADPADDFRPGSGPDERLEPVDAFPSESDHEPEPQLEPGPQDDVELATSFGPDGDAELRGESELRGDADPHGDDELGGDAELRGDADPRGDAELRGDAEPDGDADPRGDAHPSGDADPLGDADLLDEAEPLDEAGLENDDERGDGSGPEDHSERADGSERANGSEPRDDLEAESDDQPVPGPMRPLGSAPLLDSKPLPATMPGMLRPRVIDDFSLPAQRPAFEVGPEQSADLG